jgi:GT2 family glycosyltransferase
MAFTRKVFEAVGVFDPELGRIGTKLIGGEETDLFRRMSAAGMRGIYQPRAVVRHLVEPRRLKKSYFREIYLLGGRTSSRSFTTRPGRRIAGVPLFLFRQALDKFGASVRLRMARKPDRAFMEHLQGLWLVGLILGCASRRSR